MLDAAGPATEALPCLSIPLFLIIELNGIKSFSVEIFFFPALALLNNLRGILTCYYPLTRCRSCKEESCEVFSQASRQWNRRQRKTCTLVQRDGEGAYGQPGRRAPAWTLSTATCHMQPESHLFLVTLNKMLATPVGPMWGQNQMGCVLRSFYPTARENELYLWGELGAM